MKPRINRLLQAAALLFAAAAVIFLCVRLFPLVLSLREPEVQERFRSFIDGLGVWGVLLMLALQVAQIVVAVIPGEPLELMMGLMYGTLGGLALTLVGIALGTLLVCLLVRRFGMRFVERFVSSAAFERFAFLHDPAKRDSLIFLLFFIPGTPKDVLTYFAPLTGISLRRLVTIASLARIPSVVSSTMVGAALSEGKLWQSLLLFLLTGAVGLAGIWFNDRFINKKKASRKDSPQ